MQRARRCAIFRIDNSTAVDTLAAPTPLGKPEGYFSGGNPSTSTPATIVDAEWLNMIQEEGANLVLSAGLALDKADRTQWSRAIDAKIAGGAVNPGDFVLKSGDTMTGSLINNANISAGGTIDAAGGITGGSLNSNTTIAAIGAIDAGGAISGATLAAVGAIWAGTTITATTDIVAGGVISATGTMWTAGGLTSGAHVVATSFVQGGHVLSTGNIDATGQIAGASVVASGNVIANTGTGRPMAMTHNPTFGYNVLSFEGVDWMLQWEWNTGVLRWTIPGPSQHTTFWPYRNGPSGESLECNGPVSGQGAYIVTSDRRLKEGVEPIAYGLEEVRLLNPVRFTREGSEEVEIGFIAQEVQAVLPEAVPTVTDPEIMLGLRETSLIGPIVNAVKELIARVEAAETTLAGLSAP